MLVSYRKNYNKPLYMPRAGLVRKHNCLNIEAKSESNLGTKSHQSRPTTRRNSLATPNETVSNFTYISVDT